MSYKKNTTKSCTNYVFHFKMQLLLRNFQSYYIIFLIYFDMFINSEFVNFTHRQPVCDSEIYCFGRLLHTVQTSAIYSDSKEFVDKKLRYEAKIVLSKFDELLAKTNNSPNGTMLRTFVDDNFESGSEFESWVPDDLNLDPQPKFLKCIISDKLRNWALYLIKFWETLGRKMKEDVKINSHLYSIIYVPNPVIVPGGRFREFYYWDSYWVIKGLLLSNMYKTSKGMIENFLYIVEKYSFIPNGGRIYYLDRSQPPMLIPMFKAYFDATQDTQFLVSSLSTLEKEFDYWMTHHIVNVEKNNRTYFLAIYRDFSKGPRPESYKEDFKEGSLFQTEEEREMFYSNMKAAAESGWDFSSRWFILDPKNPSEKGNITFTQTQSIVPVDLNAILYWNSKILAQFNRILNNDVRWAFFEKKAKELLEAVTDVLWHDEIGAWLDYDLLHKERRNSFFPSNIAPLWTHCYDQNKREVIAYKVLHYLKTNQVMRFAGGIPTSVFYSNEQWDYPLAWPPLQYIMIMGLDNTEIREAKVLAKEIAKKWVTSNYEAFQRKKLMFEKYDATVFGSSGDGGEYFVQDGFGWTNGVILELLSRYGRIIDVDNFIHNTEYAHTGSNQSKVTSQDFIVIVVLLIAIISLLGDNRDQLVASYPH